MTSELSSGTLMIVYTSGGVTAGVDLISGATDVWYEAPGHLGSPATDGVVALGNSGANLLSMTMVTVEWVVLSTSVGLRVDDAKEVG